MEDNKQQEGVYTLEELARLEETYKYRDRIVQHAFRNNNVPESAKDVEAINGVLNSMDSAIHTMVNNRLKHKETQNHEGMLDAIANLLKGVGEEETFVYNPNKVVELPDDMTTPVIDNELSIGKMDISIKDIMGEKKE